MGSSHETSRNEVCTAVPRYASVYERSLDMT